MPNTLIQRLNAADNDFNQQLTALLSWDETDDVEIHQQVLAILNNVKTQGDSALLAYTNRFDACQFEHPAQLELSTETLKQAWDSLPSETAVALKTAAERIKAYAEQQKLVSWAYTEADGTVLGQQVTALEKVGLYVPGGKAAYPSSVLMNAIPAKVAGVEQLIMVVPTPKGESNQLVLAAAHLAGVDRLFTIGGAQAVAALAYGTATVPGVDKIVGPGNIYVATAKKLVFGKVGIDMIAGPSEILIICDGKTNPDWIAMDLFSQAEHDENAQAILIATDSAFLDAVNTSIAKLLPTMERSAIIAQSLKTRGALILVSDLAEAANIANRIAPEHLELSVEDPEALSKSIRNAGAIFMGRYTAEALGDYCAGPESCITHF